MSLRGLLKKLEYLVQKCTQSDQVHNKDGFYEYLHRAAEELLLSDVHLKNKLQGLMSCLAIFSKMHLVHKKHRMESADNVIRYLFLESAKLLLRVEFASLRRDDPTLCLLNNIIQSALAQGSCGHYQRYFELLKMLAEKPWGVPQLIAILHEDEPSKKQVSEYFGKVEYPELVVLRIEALLEGNCADLAQRMIDRLMEARSSDVHLMSLLLILLFKAEQTDEFHRQCSKVSCCMACAILRHVHETELVQNHQSAVLNISRTFLLLDWVKSTDLTCTKILLRYWLTLERHHLLGDEKEFVASFRKVLAVANSSAHLIIFIDVMESLFGSQYMVPCLEIALKLLRSERHRLDCAQLYVKDKAEINDASQVLASVCKILGRYFHGHPQMRMNCLLSAACVSPSNDHYNSIKNFFESSPENVSSDEQIAPSGVEEWTMFAALWEAVRYLQPEIFHSCLDWKEIRLRLHSHFRKSGWRFDSMAMVFKHNHNKRGIGCGYRKRKMLDESSKATLVQASALGIELERRENLSKSGKSLVAKRRYFRAAQKKDVTDSSLPFVMLKRLPTKARNKCNKQRNKSMDTKQPQKSTDGQPNLLQTESEEIMTQTLCKNNWLKDRDAKKLFDIKIVRQRCKLPLKFKADYDRKMKEEKDLRTSCDITGLFSGNNKSDFESDAIILPKLHEPVSEISGICGIDYDDNLCALGSPASSADSQATILMDQDKLDSCDSLVKSADSQMTEILENVSGIDNDDEDTIANLESYYAGLEVERCQEEELKNHAEIDLQKSTVNVDDWLKQNAVGVTDSDEISKLQNILEYCLKSFKTEDKTSDSFPRSKSPALDESFPVDSSPFISKEIHASHSALGTNDLKVSKSPLTHSDLEKNLQNSTQHITSVSGKGDTFPCSLTDPTSTDLAKKNSNDNCMDVANSTPTLLSLETSFKVKTEIFNGTLSTSSLPAIDEKNLLQESSEKSLINDIGLGRLCNGMKEPIKCQHCLSVVYSQFALRQHLYKVHRKGFPCPFCAKLIGSRWGCELHIARVHGSECQNQDRRRNQKGFRCRICLKSFPSVCGRRLHMVRVHSTSLAFSHGEMNLSKTEQADDNCEVRLVSRAKPLSKQSSKLTKYRNNVSVVLKKWSSKCLQCNPSNFRDRCSCFRAISTQKQLTASQKLGIKRMSDPDGRRHGKKLRFLATNKGSVLNSRIHNAQYSDSADASQLSSQHNGEHLRNSEDKSECAVVNRQLDSTCTFQRDCNNAGAVIPSNRSTVQNLHLKACYVRLERICLTKIKLRDCRVTVKRLSFGNGSKIAQNLPGDMKFTCPGSDLNNTAAIISQEHQKMQSEMLSTSIKIKNSWNNYEAAEMKEFDQAAPADKNSAEQRTVKNAAPSDFLSDLSRSREKTLCTICSGSSSELCVLAPLVCHMCKSICDSCHSFSLHICSAETPKENVMQASTSQAQANENRHLARNDSYLLPVPALTPVSVTRTFVNKLRNHRSLAKGRSNIKSHPLLRPNMHQQRNHSKSYRRKYVVKSKSLVGIDHTTAGKSIVSRFAYLKLCDKQRRQHRSKKFQSLSKQCVYTSKACQVELVPLSSSDLSNLKNSPIDSCSTAYLENKVREPERQPVHRNLFESFVDTMINSVKKKSNQITSEMYNPVVLLNSEASSHKPNLIRTCSEKTEDTVQQATMETLPALAQSFLQEAVASAESNNSTNKLTCMISETGQSYTETSSHVERVVVPGVFPETCGPKAAVDPQKDETVDEKSGMLVESADDETCSNDCEAPKTWDTNKPDDVCVISSDEEVQVIDLDELEGSLHGPVQNCSQKNFPRLDCKKATDRNRFSLSNSYIDTSLSDVSLCKFCKKSFTSTRLLMRHKDLKHRRVRYQNSTQDGKTYRNFSNSKFMQRPGELRVPESGFRFYCVSPALRNLKLSMRVDGVKTQSSLVSSQSPKSENEKKKDLLSRIADCRHIASPSRLRSVRSLDGSNAKCMVESRNILVIGQI